MTAARLGEAELALGRRFGDSVLLERALTHRSAVADRGGPSGPGDNEQLEYLGDAVLGLLASEYLLRRFPGWSEGQLSRSRARLVNAGSLCEAARRLRLGEYLRLGRGEEKTGGRQKPALLANAYEAVVAAIYLDAGLGEARAFVARTLLDVAVEAEGSQLELSDHKSALQELLQRRGLASASYEVTREAGPDHQKTFWVEVRVGDAVRATGVGANKKEAEQSAAEQALALIRAGDGGQGNVQ